MTTGSVTRMMPKLLKEELNSHVVLIGHILELLLNHTLGCLVLSAFSFCVHCNLQCKGLIRYIYVGFPGIQFKKMWERRKWETRCLK